MSSPIVSSAPYTFIVAAHVDVGKSTILGHILYDVGHFEQRHVEAVFKQAEADGMSKWKYARLLDVDQCEQARGKTMNFACEEFGFMGTRYRLIDTPGHKNLIPSLIAAVSHGKTVASSESRDLVGITVVSAAPGEFESGWKGGQSREDILILRGLGVFKFIVLINKMDVIDWDMKIYKQLSDTVVKFVSRTGVALSNIACLPVSGMTGEGLVWPAESISETARQQMGPFATLLQTINRLGSSTTVTLPQTPPQTAPRTSSMWRMTALIFSLPINTIITAGYEMVCHIVGVNDGNLIRAEVVRVHDHMISKADNRPRDLILKLKCDPVTLAGDTRVLLRTVDNVTIGTGLVRIRE